jgi:SAM-dependent methyltransferase
MGEEAMLSREAVINHYNGHVAQMQNRAWFYEWFLDAWDTHSIPHEAEICDVGCGTGALLERLHKRGYKHLSGTDFAEGCVVATQQAVPLASTFVHDIEQAPLPKQFDVIILTGVIDLLAEPISALQNIRASLKPGGICFITIRNRLAYWPFYHLRKLAPLIPTPRLRHWFLHFTTPLGMRRNDQPYERTYSPNEMRASLRLSGLKPVREHAYQWLPMLWIPDFPHLIRAMQRMEDLSHRVPGQSRHYWYIFACTPALSAREIS